MPNTSFLELIINNEHVDLGNLSDFGFKYSYVLEDPENFMSKQGAEAQNITLPASKNNDQIFNTFHNPQVEDLSPTTLSVAGAITGQNISTPGIGYHGGDLLEITVVGGTPAFATVGFVGGGGAMGSMIITSPGSGFVAGTHYPITTLSGAGSGAIMFTLSVSSSSTQASFRELMPCLFNVNGTIPLLKGYALLTDCTFTDKPESYDVSVYGANGLWVIDAQNMTMWDCVNPNSHLFTVAEVEASWSGFGIDEAHDFTYAPVRYRQPFDGTTLGYAGDNCVNIYHLRPSIQLYWLIIRGFRQLGYTVKSEFFETAYFRGLVLPWVWGDFYDINSKLIVQSGFSVAGSLPDPTLQPLPTDPTFPYPVFVGLPVGLIGHLGGTAWFNNGVNKGLNMSHYIAGTVISLDNGVEYNTQIPIGGIVVASGFAGTGYAPGDTGNITSFFGAVATYSVATIGGGGVVTGVTLTFGGDGTSQGYAAGNICATTTSGGGSGLKILIIHNSVAVPANTIAPFNYVFHNSGTSSGSGGEDNFVMGTNTPPDGYDDFSLYSFDNTTGTMQYDFNPPASLAASASNVTITFTLELYLFIQPDAGEATMGIECLHHQAATGYDVLTCQSILSTTLTVSGSAAYPNGMASYPTTSTACNIAIPNCSPGDTLKFRYVCLISDTGSTPGALFGVFSGMYLDNNPTTIKTVTYNYNPITNQFAYTTPNIIWSPLQSKFTMTGWLIQLGGTVELQNYDAFRNYQFLDMLGGTIDMFNLEAQTDNINKVVTFEPMFGSTLSTRETIGGYFSLSKILEWSNKRDYSQGKGSRMSLFNGCERQIDLTFKLDSNDGGQNIWGARYKGIYLTRPTYTGGVYQNNINIDNGIIAGIPGSARYMLPNRFAKGNKQLQNRFFSAVMHCTFPQWRNVLGAISPSPAPQLICIFPENTNSADAYAQTFSPKLAWYANVARPISGPGSIGGWIWIGDPAAPYAPSVANSFNLPYMFAVNYADGTGRDPVLSYSDENVFGVQVAGLMTQFYLRRFAIMRNGQLLTANLRLNLNDICNWEHQECIMIDGCLYALIQIDGYDPLTDDSTPCTMWKVVNPEQVDVDNSFPSTQSIITQPATLTNSNDIRYAPLLLFPSDMPQIG